MVYYCIRCGYNTIHKNYMRVHFNMDKICPMDIFIFLTKEEQYEISILPIHEKNYDRQSVLKILKMGPLSVGDYFKFMEREIKYQNYLKDEEEDKTKVKKKEKKVHQCLMCSHTFYDKSGLNRHQSYQRCKISKLENKFKVEEDSKIENLQISEEIKLDQEYIQTYQSKFDISHMNDEIRVLNIFKKGRCFYPLFFWFYENSRNWNVFMENEKIDWVILYDQSNVLEKKLKMMNFDIFLDDLIKKINTNIHLFLDWLKKNISMKVIFEMFKQLKAEEEEMLGDPIIKEEFIVQVKKRIVENRDKIKGLIHKSIHDYQIYFV